MRYVEDRVPLVFGGRQRVTQLGGCVSERGVDNPPLPIGGRPEGIAIPVELVLRLAMPLEMADVSFLEVNRMTLVRYPHHRDNCIGTGTGWGWWTGTILSGGERCKGNYDAIMLQ